MKKIGFWAVAAALLLAPMGFCSCSMGATTTSEMKGGLDYVQDDLSRETFQGNRRGCGCKRLLYPEQW